MPRLVSTLLALLTLALAPVSSAGALRQRERIRGAGVPEIVYSTFLGGSKDEGPEPQVRAAGIVASAFYTGAVAADAAGNTYVTGTTQSFDFPTTAGAFDTTWDGDDAFVTKLDPQGRIVYSTFLGGTESEWAFGIAVDAQGNAYVTGLTSSNDFPIVNGFVTEREAEQGIGTGFLAVLNAEGSALLYSTYFGGNFGDQGRDVALDQSGAVYVTGITTSTVLPTTPGAFQPEDPDRGYFEDAFVVKINPLAAGPASLVYYTFLGGSGAPDAESGHDNGLSIAVDSAGRATVVGTTNSPDFPVTPDAAQPSPGGKYDAFVATLNAGGTGLVYATYLGGSGDDEAAAVAIPAAAGTAAAGAGGIYVAGSSASTNFPSRAAPQPKYGGGASDAFLSRFISGELDFSTLLGGGKEDRGLGVSVGDDGAIYLTGGSSSGNFPAVNPLQGLRGKSDAFLARFSESASAAGERLRASAGGPQIDYSTLIGGSGDDIGFDVAARPGELADIIGSTGSPDFPTVDPIQSELKGSEDAFFGRVKNNPPPPLPGKIAASPKRVNFRKTAAGESALPRELRIRNRGAGNLVGTISEPAPPFALSGGTSFDIPPGGEHTVSIGFSPTGAGKFTGSLEIASNDPRRPLVSVKLSGKAR